MDGDFSTGFVYVLVLEGFIQLVMLFAVVKLFSINNKLDEVIKHLQLANSQIIDFRKEIKPSIEEKKAE